jgi:hypothetical protein
LFVLTKNRRSGIRCLEGDLGPALETTWVPQSFAHLQMTALDSGKTLDRMELDFQRPAVVFGFA